MVNRPILAPILRTIHRLVTNDTLVVIDPQMGADEKNTVLRAIAHYRRFFGSDIRVSIPDASSTHIGWKALRSRSVLVTGKYRSNQFGPARLPWCQRIDPRLDADAAWNWHIALSRTVTLPANHRQLAHHAFRSLVERLKTRGLQRAYIFGTGPSLGTAATRDFRDGYRIVCNTIVRDPELMRHLNPDIIVAADALYHFSDTDHAIAFRNDLKARMRELDVTFCYPDTFQAFVRQEFHEFNGRCIPVPGGGALDLTADLTKDFRLPALGNVLGMILLPLACNLAKHVCLLGFDGRKSDDKLFWSNSERHSYPSLIERMSREYPAFYNKHVPQKDPSAYVRDVQGDSLDAAMSTAEKNGWRFTMLAPSTSPALAKRPLEHANRNRSGSSA
jgi:hypothetical protein